MLEECFQIKIKLAFYMSRKLTLKITFVKKNWVKFNFKREIHYKKFKTISIFLLQAISYIQYPLTIHTFFVTAKTKSL